MTSNSISRAVLVDLADPLSDIQAMVRERNSSPRPDDYSNDLLDKLVAYTLGSGTADELSATLSELNKAVGDFDRTIIDDVDKRIHNAIGEVDEETIEYAMYAMREHGLTEIRIPNFE